MSIIIIVIIVIEEVTIARRNGLVIKIAKNEFIWTSLVLKVSYNPITSSVILTGVQRENRMSFPISWLSNIVYTMKVVLGA